MGKCDSEVRLGLASQLEKPRRVAEAQEVKEGKFRYAAV